MTEKKQPDWAKRLIPALNEYSLDYDLGSVLIQIETEINKAREEARAAPMGVSQWREHGKKHECWDYFIEEIIESLPKPIKDEVLETNCGSTTTRELPGSHETAFRYCTIDGFNQAIKQVKIILQKHLTK